MKLLKKRKKRVCDLWGNATTVVSFWLLGVVPVWRYSRAPRSGFGAPRSNVVTLPAVRSDIDKMAA